MHWQHVQEHDKNTRFYHSFQRMKRIGRPRRRIGTLMVHQVKMFKKPFVVHQPVRPVKIGIVQKEQDGKCGEKISVPVLLYIGIKSSGACNGGNVQNNERHQRKNRNGDDGITNFAGIVFTLGCTGLYFFIPYPFAQQNIKQQKRCARYQKITTANGIEIIEVILPLHNPSPCLLQTGTAKFTNVKQMERAGNEV